MKFNLKAAILAALALAPAISFADEAAVAEEIESNLSFNAQVVSDYVFRGISQTNGVMAVQGGADYAFGDSGFYLGAWGSNTNFGYQAAPDWEIDFYGGWAYDFNETFNTDLSYIYYSYYGADAGEPSSNYGEFIAKFGMTDIAVLTVAYADDYSGLGGSATYVNLGNSWDLGKGYSINAGFGRTFQDSSLEDQGLADYNDWNIGFAKNWGIITVALNYYDTNLPSDYFQPLRDEASDSIVATFKISN
jgi:uncharacterized protein (TIGR02001 family)